jgi:hypothetical protein
MGSQKAGDSVCTNHNNMCAPLQVRRAAAKLLSALVASYPSRIAQLYQAAAGELVGRFREREENVKVDVFAAYCDLVTQVGCEWKGRASRGQGGCRHKGGGGTSGLLDRLLQTGRTGDGGGAGIGREVSMSGGCKRRGGWGMGEWGNEGALVG